MTATKFNKAALKAATISGLAKGLADGLEIIDICADGDTAESFKAAVLKELRVISEMGLEIIKLYEELPEEEISAYANLAVYYPKDTAIKKSATE